MFEVSTLDFSKLAPRESEVYTEVYRHLFAYCKPMTAGYRPLPEKFFLSCRKQDVGEGLLSQLEAEGYRVGPGSRFEFGKGFHCSASDIQWISADETKVWGGILYGEVGGQWGFFTLRKSGEKWSVTSWRVTLLAQPGKGADRGVTAGGAGLAGVLVAGRDGTGRRAAVRQEAQPVRAVRQRQELARAHGQGRRRLPVES